MSIETRLKPTLVKIGGEEFATNFCADLVQKFNNNLDALYTLLEGQSKAVHDSTLELAKKFNQSDGDLLISKVRIELIDEMVCALLTLAAQNRVLAPISHADYASHCLQHYEAEVLAEHIDRTDELVLPKQRSGHNVH